MAKPEAYLDAYQLWIDPSGVRFLIGLATGHPRLAGRRRQIRTSPLVNIDLAARRAETLNTRYVLGRRIERFAVNADGEITLIELGGLVAERTPGTDAWTMRRGDELVGTFASDDIRGVLDHLLDFEPTIEDLCAQITADNRPSYEP